MAHWKAMFLYPAMTVAVYLVLALVARWMFN